MSSVAKMVRLAYMMVGGISQVSALSTKSSRDFDSLQTQPSTNSKFLETLDDAQSTLENNNEMADHASQIKLVNYKYNFKN